MTRGSSSFRGNKVAHPVEGGTLEKRAARPGCSVALSETQRKGSFSYVTKAPGLVSSICRRHWRRLSIGRARAVFLPIYNAALGLNYPDMRREVISNEMASNCPVNRPKIKSLSLLCPWSFADAAWRDCRWRKTRGMSRRGGYGTSVLRSGDPRRGRWQFACRATPRAVRARCKRALDSWCCGGNVSEVKTDAPRRERKSSFPPWTQPAAIPPPPHQTWAAATHYRYQIHEHVGISYRSIQDAACLLLTHSH